MTVDTYVGQTIHIGNLRVKVIKMRGGELRLDVPDGLSVFQQGPLPLVHVTGFSDDENLPPHSE